MVNIFDTVIVWFKIRDEIITTQNKMDVNYESVNVFEKFGEREELRMEVSSPGGYGPVVRDTLDNSTTRAVFPSSTFHQFKQIYLLL